MNNKIAIDTTNKNIKSLGINNAEVLFMNDIDAINMFIKKKEKFDIIFLDPPYKQGRYEELVSLFINNDLLTKDAIVVMESDRDIEINNDYFSRRRDYKYGDIKVIILWR